jgi:hypothetical protein
MTAAEPAVKTATAYYIRIPFSFALKGAGVGWGVAAHIRKNSTV